MGKKSATSLSSSSPPSLWRRYRLALVIISLLALTWLLFDHQSLTLEDQVMVSRLNKELKILKNQLQNVRKQIRGWSIVEEDDPVNVERRNAVRDAMIHAWTCYEKYAWGHDELQPQTKDAADSFGGLGATLVDSLDTLYIMGLDQQFQRAREWVASSLDFNKNYGASVFETTIRVIGGLLSAYDLSEDKLFLDKARDIADRLLPAWDTPSGIPYNIINLMYGDAHNPKWAGGKSILADAASEQLEFIALSQRTKDPKYQQKVEYVIKEFHKIFPADGLLPIYLDPHTGTTSKSKITFGALGDSFYEYLLKAWIQGNKTKAVKHYREMWETSMEGLKSLTRRTTPSSFAYICEKIGNSLIDKMDELACFAPGMLALGSSGYDPGQAEKMLFLAEELAWTCYNFYQRTPTKLAAENYNFLAGQDMTVGTTWNILRPETIESLFYLWRLTGNKTYQEWGWNIFQAFENNSRTDTGYSGLKDVSRGDKDNVMQTFFLAETLKYLYLLFSPTSFISLDEWVFNTEAHPLRIVTQTWHKRMQKNPSRAAHKLIIFSRTRKKTWWHMQALVSLPHACRSEARAACDAAEYCAETQVDAGSLGRGRTACRLFKQSKPDMRVLQAMLHRIIEDGKVLVSRSLTDNVEVMCLRPLNM